MKKSQEEPLQLLKINEARLQVFLEGLDNYEFKIKQHPPSYREPIENKTFFEHFYGVMQKYAHEEADSPLGKMLVLYGVSVFEQKYKTNLFLVSFIYGLEQYYHESPEIQFCIDIVNSFSDDIDTQKKKIKKWLNIKERIVLHYTDRDGYVELSLDSFIVNCNEWANLFKGLSYLFNNYETQMIKRLIRKYKQLKIEETNNVIGSIFAKAVFLLHEDVLKEEAKNQPDNNETLKQLLLAETRKVESWLKKKKVEKGEKEIKSAIETSKKHFAEIRPTLGRKAHRETESTAVIEISDLESKKVEKMKNTEIIQQLEVLETKIYKEGRVKRNRQGLLDVTTSKLKANSEQFDELYNLTVRLCKDYNKLVAYGERNFPSEMEEVTIKDVNELKKFEKNTNLYQKSVKMDVIN